MKTTRIEVRGMTCMGCVASVSRVLRNVTGVFEVNVSLERAAAEVSFDPQRADEEKLKVAIRNAGYETG